MSSDVNSDLVEIVDANKIRIFTETSNATEINSLTEEEFAQTDPHSVSEEMNVTKEQKSSPSTSSALMYSEYMNTNEPEHVAKIFENKTKKPVILSYGESPMYQKYSKLLDELKETKDEFPTGWGKKFPIVSIHCLVKKKEDDSDSDIEDSRLVFYGDKEEESDEDSSDEESSDEEKGESNASNSNIKVQLLKEIDNDSTLDGKVYLESEISSAEQEECGEEVCDLSKTCIDSTCIAKSDAEISVSELEQAPKRPRLE